MRPKQSLRTGLYKVVKVNEMSYSYILYSKQLDKYYIGSTRDLPEDRLRKHLSDHKGFTSKAKDWVIVFLEFHQDYSLSHKRELQIKSWKSKRMIETLVSNCK
jgi:putative endonuclease